MIANNYKSSRPSLAKNFIILCSSVLFTSMAFANPQGGTVTSGNATITQGPNSTVIQQNSQQAIIEWQSFNIGAKDKTHFQQPTNGIALNRINANQGMTQIYGQLSATGRIILVNAAGIYFGVGSVIHVGGIIASTSNISNANFLAGKYIFDQPSPYHAGIINEGIIKAADYGLVALIGSSVTNHGLIEAELGSIILATGSKFTLDFYGDQLINFSVDSRADNGGRIINTGSLIADGGKILVTAEAAQGVLDNVIDMQGVAQARSVAQQDGQIILSASAGEIDINGQLITTGENGTAGGTIQISAPNITITPLALINANGSAGGGNITLTANKVLLSGELTTIGKSSSAVGGNITIAANNIMLGNKAMLNASGGAAGGNVSLSGTTTTDKETKANYIGIGYLTNVIANSMNSGAAGNINLMGDAISIAGNLSAQGLGTKSVGGSVVVAANSFVTQGASLNVSGNAGGGSVTVVAQNSRANSAYINIDSRSVVLANTLNTGTAGTINLVADAVTIAGNISAQGLTAASLGGNIQVAANAFIATGATMNVSGGAGGGSVSISHASTSPSYINIDAGSAVLANALNTGAAGTINLAADSVTIAGNISAQGLTPVSLGGNIQVAANAFIASGATMNVSSGSGGGSVIISHTSTSPSYINIDAGSVVLANALNTGMAGTINFAADNITIAGNISAQGFTPASLGGNIQVAANSFIATGATLNVSGGAGGGSVIISNASTTPSYINIDAGSVVLANALNTGLAGTINLAADDVTIAGSISAQGLTAASLGGNIQVAANAFIATGATMNVSSGAGGGSVIISNASTTPSYINIDAGSVVLANALNTGMAGTINLAADDVTIAGKVSAQGLAPASLGGNIQVAANAFIATGATMNVSGGAGGGSVNISHASTTPSYINIDAGSVVLANALNTGTAGNINLAADNVTIAGNISAQGLTPASFGGNIQVAANAFIATGATMNVSAKTDAGSVTVSGQGHAKNSTYIDIDGLSMIVANAMGDNGIGGKINLYGDNVTIAGKLSAQATGAETIGGAIGVYGQNLYVLPGAVINANADFVAGALTIGGNPNSITRSTTSQYVTISVASNVSAAVTGKSGIGGMITVSGDNTYLGGTLDVSGLNFASSGGEVLVSGNNVTIAPLAVINASGQQFGGEILLGGNLANPRTTTASVDVDAGSTLNAAAYGNTNQQNSSATGGLIQIYATNTTIDGNLDVAATLANSGDQGGKVEIFANNTINVGSSTQINAQGDAKGGEVLIGGDKNGVGPDPDAQFTNVALGSNINTSALTNGNGGDVVLMATNTTNFNGSIVARGGALSGNGAQVEVSGKQNLDYAGTTDLRAPHGTTGTITVDPQNITIQTAGPNTPNSSNSVLTVATLETMLATANVLVVTDATGNEPGDITVANNVTWNNSNKLTLSAYRDVNIDADISNNAGGSLTVLADNTVDGVGTITFGTNGSVNFGGGGQVNMTYEPANNNFRYPNTYSSNVHVSNGSTVSYNPLNFVTPENNNAIISSFSVVPNIMESLSLALGQVPLEVIMPESAATTLALENNLEVITETTPSPVSVILMDQPAGSGCGESATCVSSEFVIE